jgi:hypothetical protein
MDNSTPLADFEYAPLYDSSSGIRLLKLLELEQCVLSRLNTWTLKSAPLYHALSSTWGDAASSTQIVVDNKKMTIRTNFEYALRQAYASKASRYFWVDAFCIDQTSTPEKNHQVAMMGRIYTSAAHVLACVGSHGDDSAFLLETMKAQKRLLASIQEHITIYDHGDFKGWNTIRRSCDTIP